MSYTVEYVADKVAILAIVDRLALQLNWTQDKVLDIFMPEAIELLGNKESITFPLLSSETVNGLRETSKYYQHNVRCLDYPDRDYGLVIAKKDDTIIGSIWLHFHSDYATFIGIRSTIPYLLARSVDKNLTPLSSLLIPWIIELARAKGLCILYCDPLLVMTKLLEKYYGFKSVLINHPVNHIWGWNSNFTGRLPPENIEIEKEYSAKIGEEWHDSMANTFCNFFVLSL